MISPERERDGVVRHVRASFAAQGFMRTLNARLVAVTPGRVVIDLPATPEVSQQDGYVHAAAVTAILDNACGFATLSTASPGHRVLTVEFKVNLLDPAVGERIEATGVVLRPGRTSVCTAEAWAVAADGTRSRVALMQATMAVRPAP